jgi:hypothetical protein
VEKFSLFFLLAGYTFNYRTGPLKDLCHNLQADAVIFTFGSHEIFSPLREEILKKAKTANNVKLIVSSILTGSVNIHISYVTADRTCACCLVSNKIIWHKQ